MTIKREGYDLVLLEVFGRNILMAERPTKEYRFRGGELMVSSSDRIEVYAPKKVEWNGEGLPPVGTICDVKLHLEARKTVEIIAHFKNRVMVAVFIPVGDVDKRVNQAVADCFMPIRTLQQIALEKSENEIRQMLKELPDFVGKATIGDAETICTLLHQAGYRKFEIID